MSFLTMEKLGRLQARGTLTRAGRNDQEKMDFWHRGGTECDLAAFEFNKQTWAKERKGLLLHGQRNDLSLGWRYWKSAELVVGAVALRVRASSRGPRPGRKKEDRESLDGPV